MSISVAVCEDNQIFAEKVKNLCEEYFAIKQEDYRIELFSCGEELLKVESLSWDVLFLDIEMGEMSGIDVKNQLVFRAESVRIIFLSFHEECMREAFGKNVFGFINKGDAEKKIPEVLEYVCRDIEREHITWKIGGNGISINEIRYLQADGGYVNVIADGEDLLLRVSLKQCEEELKEMGFIRVHRSALIHLKYVTRITEKYVEIEGGYRVKVARGMCRKVKKAYLEYIRKNTIII